MNAVRGKRRAPLWADLTLLAAIGLVLLGAIGAGGASLYQQYYGPGSFVHGYLTLLSEGRAADALQLPGIDREVPEGASEALLRRAALAPLEDIEIVSEESAGGVTTVTASYTAAGEHGESSFEVKQEGWIGVTPKWAFHRSPLASLDLTLRGADRFAVNGFEIHRRQISEAEPLDPMSLLVFTPGLYEVSVDTAISVSSGSRLLADTPRANTPLDIQTQPTEEFIMVVQENVEKFLVDECATQQVLMPTGCPFGFKVPDEAATLPEWSIVTQPQVTVAPDGANWIIPITDAVAHIEVDNRSYYDGEITKISEDVPFQVDGTITILADGSASIRVGIPGS